MAGLQTIAEGIPIFRVSTIAPGSAPLNSLKSGFQVATLQQGAQVWVDDEKAMYRWEEDSAQTNDDLDIVTPTGVTGNGRFIKVGSSADVWGAGIVRAETVAALNALPAFPGADYAILRSLVDVEDQNGGLFRVLPDAATSGFTGDDWDVIDLTGVHAPQQLVRVSPGMGTFAWANSATGAVTIAGVNTPVFCTIAHIGFGQGPWEVNGTTQFRWIGIPDTGAVAVPAIFTMAITATGTAGDIIQASIVAAGSPATTLAEFKGVVDANGNLTINGSLAISFLPTEYYQLAFENKSNGNSISLVTSYSSYTRIPGNQEDFY